MIANRPCNADATRRTLGLEPRSYIYRFTVEIRAIRDRVTNVDADTKANGPISTLLAIMNGDLLLHVDRTADGAINAIENNEERVATGLDDFAPVFVDRRVD